MHIFPKAVIALATLLMASACNSYVEKKPLVTSTPTIAPTSTLSFADVKTELLTPYCIGCHNSSNAKGGVNLENYANVTTGSVNGKAFVVAGSPSTSRLVQVIQNGSMPIGGKVPSNVLARLELWISEGALENIKASDASASTSSPRPTTAVAPPVPSPTPTDPTLVPDVLTFAEIDAKILTPYCVACHTGEYAAWGIDLSSFVAIQASNSGGSLLKVGDPENSSLYSVLPSGYMPEGGPALDPSLIEMMKKWILEGAKQ